MITPQKLWLYFLADANNRTLSWVNGTVIKNNIPTPLEQNPIGWKDIEIKFGTNHKYFSLQRSFSTQLKFVNDGANILRWYAYQGKGFEEDLYVIIMKYNREDGKYYLEYRGKLDFAKFNDDPYTGVTMNTLEGGLLRYLNANSGVTYEIPCDGRNPKAQKVIFEGVTLQTTIGFNAPKIAYDVHDVSYSSPSISTWNTSFISLVKANSQGDSVGLITGNPTYDLLHATHVTDQSFINIINDSSNPLHENYVIEFTQKVDCRIYGTLSVKPGIIDSNGNVIYSTTPNGNLYTGRLYLYLVTKRFKKALNSVDYHKNGIENGFSFSFDDTETYFANEKVYLVIYSDNLVDFGNPLIPTDDFKVNISVTTKQPPSTAYFLRPLDLLQAIVSKMTYGKYTARSNYFNTINNEVATCGDALRNINAISAGIDGYYIKRSFDDWFKDYDSGNCLGCKIVNNVLWVEPRHDLYGDDSEIFDLGEVSEFTIVPDIERVFNSIKTGSPDQNYQGVSQNDGKLEVNSTQEWQLSVTSMKKEYDITSKARKDALGIEFIRQSLPSTGATYNSSDNEVFLIKISDTTEQLAVPILTSVGFTINHSPTVPQITFPGIGASTTIHNDKPLVSGYAAANTQVGILIDGTQEGYCTSDSNGFWSYQIVAALSSFAINDSGIIVDTGQHTIEAAYTNGSGIVIGGATTTLSNVVIDTTSPAAFSVTYPANNDSLYNNLPVIRGTGVPGSQVNITIDGVVLSVQPTVDNSCNWILPLSTALSDKQHALKASNIDGISVVNITFSVNATAVTYPLITSITDGNTLYKSQPTIKGVAIPNSTVTLYLDFVTIDDSGNPSHFAQTTADAYGVWSITAPTSIGDGSHQLSTTPSIEQVNVIESGYKLEYGNFDSISGVIDNTVFNLVGMTPKQCLLAHGSYIRSVNFQQQDSNIIMTTAAKNKNLVTITNGITYSERADINIGTLAEPFFLPWVFNFKTKVPYTFDQVFSNIPKGYLKFYVKGFPLYALPIGEMGYKPAEESTQTWKVLASSKNNLITFLQLSGSFLIIETYNKNMLTISNLNPLKWIYYNFTADPKYNSLDINEDAFVNRLKSYLSRPNYFQKWQTTDTISLQFITAALEQLTIKVYNSELILVGSHTMTLSNNQYVSNPYFLQQVDISLSGMPTDNYLFAVYSGDTPLAISEWCSIADNWSNTVLLEYSNTYNKINGFFSNGWSPMLRVEGFLSPYKPDSDFVEYEDEKKDIELLHAVPYIKRDFLIGKPTGIPDWMATKVNEILLLNKCFIEGKQYSRTPDSKFEETINNGYTMSYYKTTLMKSVNDSSLTIKDSTLPIPEGGLVASLDGSTFGQAGSVIQITVNPQ